MPLRACLLAGASLGRAAVLTAAPSIDPEPAGVLSFAGETNLSPDLDTIAVAPELKAPLLLLTSPHDRYVSVADYRKLEKASGSRDKRVVVYRGTWHGWELLYDAPFKARVNPLVLDFLEEHSGEGE
jgi:dienelactone hydrolase